MANLCEHCKHAMSAHDNHASCPQCRVAAGDCSVDPKNPCTTCEGWTRKQWARLRRSLIGARARAEQRGKQHWTVACPHVEAWILAKPVSTSASEISSQAGEGDFDDETLVDTPKQHEVQVLVVQSQNGANMATSSTTTAAGTTITAQSTAAFQVAGPSTKEPIVEQVGQDTPSVIQGAPPEQRYGSQPYFSGQQYTAPITAAQPYTAVPQPYNAAAQPYTAAAQPYIAPYNNNNMPAMSARPAEPMGYFGQGGQLPFMLTEEQLLHQQQLLREKQEFDAWRASRAQDKTQSQPQILSEAEVNVEVNVDSSERSASVARARPQDQVTKQAKAKRAGSASTSHRSPSPKRDYPRGSCTVTRPSQASPRKAEHTVAPAQDLEAFKADMTSMLSDMLQASFQKFASEFNTNSGGQGNNSKEDTVPKQVFSAAGFSDEVSRLTAAPRRPSTNRMYDDRWCRFTRWAVGQGTDPLDPTAAQVASFLFDLFDTHGLSPRTIKGYRTCIGSVLNRTGRAKVVLHRTISDMIASMELQRPRATPVLPQWDLGVVLEALNKPPYEPLREASFKHLTLKTVFLLAMASAGRRSELHALRFDQNYIQFKPKGAGVTLYFSPEFMRKNQKPNQVNDPWYIPAIPTGKPEFGTPNCPVRALCYYHRYLTEHPELRKDRRRLFVPIKDNNAGKELSAPSISRWICTTIVDSHAAIQDSKNLSGSVKAHEVTAFQQGRPPFCHEGRKMVQWWYLYFLLPQRPLPAS